MVDLEHDAGWTAVWAMMPGSPDMAALKPVLLLYGFLFLAGLAINAGLALRYVAGVNPWPVKRARLDGRPWSWRDLTHILIALLLLHTVVLGLLHTVHLAGWLGPEQEQWVWMIAHSLALHWATIGLVFMLAWRRRLGWTAAFARRGAMWWRDLAQGSMAYVAAVPALVLYAALYHVWLQWVGHEPEPQDVVRLFATMDRGFLFYYLLGLAVLVAPISEELLFRGILLPALSQKWGVGWAITISAALFAAVHFHVPSLAPLFVFAVALSLAYIYTESIVVPIVMHALFNMVALWVMMQIG